MRSIAVSERLAERANRPGFATALTSLVPTGVFLVLDSWLSLAAAMIGASATTLLLLILRRSRGTLEERSRFAGEIHDTLAQGFTSIVLLARTGARPGADPRNALESIKEVAQQNLDTARRLVGSHPPGELDHAALPDVLRRHLRASLPEGISGEVHIVGDPVPLPGSIETVLLPTAQEGIRNACQHAEPQRVDLTLAYLNDEVNLEVRDDGSGYRGGEVRDRGTLTGGQGLTTLVRRVESLSGLMRIEPGDEGGSILHVQLPVES